MLKQLDEHYVKLINEFEQKLNRQLTTEELEFVEWMVRQQIKQVKKG